MINLYKILALLTIIGISQQSFGQTKLTREQIVNAIRGNYWKLSFQRTDQGEFIYGKSDSLNWQTGKHGFLFEINGTFEESMVSSCARDRMPHKGMWYASNDTLFLTMTTGEKISTYKVTLVTDKALVIKYTK